MRLKVRRPGLLNAVVYWHDVDGVDGFAHNARIVYLERTVRVEAASKVSVIGGSAAGGARTFKLRGNVVRVVFLVIIGRSLAMDGSQQMAMGFFSHRLENEFVASAGHTPGATSLGGHVGRRGERGEPALSARALLRAHPPRVPWGRRTRSDGHLEGHRGCAPVRFVRGGLSPSSHHHIIPHHPTSSHIIPCRHLTIVIHISGTAAACFLTGGRSWRSGEGSGAWKRGC
jgi:hypothetical protein